MTLRPTFRFRGYPQSSFWIGLFALAVCAAAFAWGWYQANPASVGGEEEAIAAPAPAPAASATAIDSLRTVSPDRAAPASPEPGDGVPWPLWEFQLAQPLPERDPPLTPLPWRLIGAGRSEGKWHLIVLREGKAEPEYFSVGDRMPGNYQITAISDEDVTLRLGSRTLVLSYIGTQ